MTLFAIRDMIPTDSSLLINYSNNKEYYTQLRAFIKNIEDVNQDGAMIFELPYMPHPEAKLKGTLSDYEQMKPYLVSNKLRWSYGAIKGRELDKWFKSFSHFNFKAILTELKKTGFSGILVFKNGFAKEYRNEVIKFLNIYLNKPLFENDEYVYYSL